MVLNHIIQYNKTCNSCVLVLIFILNKGQTVVMKLDKNYICTYTLDCGKKYLRNYIQCLNGVGSLYSLSSRYWFYYGTQHLFKSEF